MEKHANAHLPLNENLTHDQGKRSRIENRQASVWSLAKGTGHKVWHDHFKVLIRIDRDVDRFCTKKKNWVNSKETAYYLSTREMNAQQANHVVREHWGVENKNHYVRDVTMGEDKSRIRCNPCIFALLRSFALNILRFNKISNISQALYENVLNIKRVLAYAGI